MLQFSHATPLLAIVVKPPLLVVSFGDDIDFLPLAAVPKKAVDTLAMEPDFSAFPYQFAVAFGAEGKDQLELRITKDAEGEEEILGDQLALAAGRWRTQITTAAQESSTTARLTKIFRPLEGVTTDLYEEGHFHEAKEYLDEKWKTKMKK